MAIRGTVAQRKSKRLAAISLSRLEPGLYADGGCLYLRVSSQGTRSWIFRYRIGDASTPPRDHGLGPYPDVSLEKARAAAARLREGLREGVDPIAAKRSRLALAAEEKAKAITFDGATKAYIEAHEAAWKNAKHAKQWRATLAAYASKEIGSLPVAAIDTQMVLKVIEPLWAEKTETASRLRGRIEAILAWATVRGMRRGDNPARWRGHLDHLLPERRKVAKVEHHAALPYYEIAAFMKALHSQKGEAARGLEFLILTAARTSEVIGAGWEEIDIAAGLWTVPAGRIKAGREHRVPLSPAAIAILRRIPENERRGPLFRGGNKRKPGLSSNAFLALLKRMKRDDLTAHGFRSTFRDWAAERTSYPREVAEMSLAHAIGDKVEAAYRRGDLFEKRRRLMADWAKFIATTAPAGKVVAISSRKRG